MKRVDRQRSNSFQSSKPQNLVNKTLISSPQSWPRHFSQKLFSSRLIQSTFSHHEIHCICGPFFDLYFSLQCIFPLPRTITDKVLRVQSSAPVSVHQCRRYIEKCKCLKLSPKQINLKSDFHTDLSKISWRCDTRPNQKCLHQNSYHK